jgi:ribosomal protein S18 acetylase RimI-like enzyme
VNLRRLTLEDMDAVARIHRHAFDERLPWLTGLHTPEEDRAYFRGPVFEACEVWGAEVDGEIVGFIACREGWIDQLYVNPDAQGQGAGSILLAQAKARFPELRLWTFQRNAGARRYYEARGFVLETMTDGSHNEEREPDVLYRWARG